MINDKHFMWGLHIITIIIYAPSWRYGLRIALNIAVLPSDPSVHVDVVWQLCKKQISKLQNAGCAGRACRLI